MFAARTQRTELSCPVSIPRSLLHPVVRTGVWPQGELALPTPRPRQSALSGQALPGTAQAPTDAGCSRWPGSSWHCPGPDRRWLLSVARLFLALPRPRPRQAALSGQALPGTAQTPTKAGCSRWPGSSWHCPGPDRRWLLSVARLFLALPRPRPTLAALGGQALPGTAQTPTKAGCSQWPNTFWHCPGPDQGRLLSVARLFLALPTPRPRQAALGGQALPGTAQAPTDAGCSRWPGSSWHCPDPDQGRLLSVAKHFLALPRPRPRQAALGGQAPSGTAQAPTDAGCSRWPGSSWHCPGPDRRWLLSVARLFLAMPRPRPTLAALGGQALPGTAQTPTKAGCSQWPNTFWHCPGPDRRWLLSVARHCPRPDQGRLLSVARLFLALPPPRPRQAALSGQALVGTAQTPPKTGCSQWPDSSWRCPRPDQGRVLSVARHLWALPRPPPRQAALSGQALPETALAPTKAVCSQWPETSWHCPRHDQDRLLSVARHCPRPDQGRLLSVARLFLALPPPRPRQAALSCQALPTPRPRQAALSGQTLPGAAHAPTKAGCSQ
ncbi:hypothetical protein NDU88_007172 [Pleurodeles waltl]|uniref:Uncharacterized protein n=1 Tax=Pleurodeles waltl TaxID=8319 RepID=A0AAV7WIG3_PLEWA|nr:hypothetical protein NDU88_007172 [Pleurodeles waltl]